MVLANKVMLKDCIKLREIIKSLCQPRIFCHSYKGYDCCFETYKKVLGGSDQM